MNMELTVIPEARAYGGARIPQRPTTDAKRMTRLSDLEHHIRCWVHAYVQELEGRRTGGSNHLTYSDLRARHWRTLCDLMLGILAQEGRVETIEREQDEEEDGS